MALFRCLSCRYTFSGEISQPHRLGSPGRVYLTKQPELACNVQEYPENLYLRKTGAQQCSVQSSMLLPIFAASRNDYQECPLYSGVLLQETKHKDDVCVGVIEIVQTSDDMRFIEVAENLHAVMQSCGLSTCSGEDLRSLMPNASYICSNLPINTGIMMNEKITTSDEFKEAQATSSGGISDTDPVPDARHPPLDLEGTSGSKVAPKTIGANAVGVDLWKESHRRGISKTRLSKICKRKGIQEYSIKDLRMANHAIDVAWKGSLEQPAEEAGGVYLDSRWETLSSLLPERSMGQVFPSARTRNITIDTAHDEGLPEGAVSVRSGRFRSTVDSRYRRRPRNPKRTVGENKRSNKEATVSDKDIMVDNDGITAVLSVGNEGEPLPSLPRGDSEIVMMDPSMMDLLLFDSQFAPDINFTDQELEKMLEFDKS